jgi:hypothetical protein
MDRNSRQKMLDAGFQMSPWSRILAATLKGKPNLQPSRSGVKQGK